VTRRPICREATQTHCGASAGSKRGIRPNCSRNLAACRPPRANNSTRCHGGFAPRWRAGIVPGIRQRPSELSQPFDFFKRNRMLYWML
jgi:hypothetical protein